MAHCCCCKFRTSNKIADASEENEEYEYAQQKRRASTTSELSAQTFDSEFTEVEIGDNLQAPDSWTVAGVFKRIFHAAPDNKLAQKLYGSKKGVLKERKRQDVDCCIRWMIHPCSHFRWYWDMVIVLLLLFTITVLPVSIAFYSDDQTNPAWLTVNVIVDVLFISDIVINFKTGIFSSDNADEVILDPKLVAKRYMKGWFLIDLLSSFPFDYFMLIATQGQASSPVLKASRALRVIRLAKLLSLLRLLRLSKLLRFLQKWEDLFDLAGGVLRILKLIMLMMLLSHWNGCIQFLIPMMQDVPRNSWIAISNLQYATVGEQYSWSLFKAISHMLCIGFGRWPPQNVTETWLTIISMMVGATFYALFIGNMSTLLLSIDSSGRLFNEKLSQVEEYMRYRKIPQDLRVRVQEFYEHRYRRKFFNEPAILDELSGGLREDIVSHNCRDLVQSVPFFQNASPHFVTAVLTKLKFEVYLKDEYIVRAGTKGDRMYFIQTGVVDVLTDDEEVATSLSSGSHFGEICLLTEDRRVATIKSVTTCDLFSLSKKNFQAILEDYPEMRCALEAIALRRLSKIGKKPPMSEHGKTRLSTTIPPPHISNEPSDEAAEKARERKASQASDPAQRKVSTVNPAVLAIPEPLSCVVGPSGEHQCMLPPLKQQTECASDPHLIQHDSSSEPESVL